jgi:microcystin-dependent protein
MEMDWVAFVLFFIVIFLFFMSMAYTNSKHTHSYREAMIGDMKHSARISDFCGWLLCDGRSVDRVMYHELYELIGTRFGSTSATTFNIPDCRGRILGSVNSSHAAGSTVGAETHTLTVPELASHTHDGTTATSGEHTHAHNAPGGQNNTGLTIANGAGTAINSDSSQGELNVFTLPRELTINNNGSHTHTFTSNSTGTNQPFNIMQPTIYVGNVFIYYGHTH